MKLGKNQYLTIAINAIYDSHLKESRIEPRIGWDYFLNESWAVYLKTGLYSQRPEILQMIDPVGNTDLTTERSTHYLGGVEYSLTANYSLRTEFYYKTLEQLVVNISALSPERIYSNQARGSAYGVELLFNKNLTDKWYGWASIGLSKTQRTNLATQQDMPFKYDKPIIINLVGNYALTDRWTIGAKWNLQSGGRYTPIIDLQENKRFKGTFDPVYGKLNTERLPFYHQLDIRVEYSRKKPWGYWTFYTDLLNAYHKKNITEYRYAPNKKDTIKTPKGFNENVPVTASTSLGIIPSIGFEINF